MSNLTFGEQVKIVLSRKGMTIKELAEMIEERTGKKMSRQNLTQRLGRDNFQEQDMRMIASILECPFELSILGDEPAQEAESVKAAALAEETESTEIDESAEEAEQSASVGEQENAKSEAGKIDENAIDESAIDENASEESEAPAERGLTVGEFLEIQEEMDETSSDKLLKEVLAEMDAIERENKEWEQETQAHSDEESTGKPKKGGWLSHLRFCHRDEAKEEAKEDIKEEAKEGSKAGVADAVSQNESGDEKEAEEGKTPIGQQEAEKLRQEKGNLVYFSEQRGLAGTSLKEKAENAENAENAGEANRAEDISKTAGDKTDEAAAEEENTQLGDVNPYTGREYATNSVRMHPKRIGYVQVYSRKEHKWTDMTEWAFLGYQERKKVLLGKDYEPPIYLD